MLEVAYYNSGIIMTFTIIIGIRQIYYLKEDIKISNQRAATEKSIEFLNWFSSFYLPKYSTYMEKANKLCKDKKNFDNLFSRDIQIDEKFLRKIDDDDKIVIYLKAKLGGEDLINHLEFFAAAMISGLAESEIVYKPLARVYCDICEELYLLICFNRENTNTNLFSNVVELYKKWSHRIEKERLLTQQKELECKMNQYEDGKLKTIGL
ncbi:MAG: hypothetical protein AB7V50_11285 [Vampirovibrionia bacterium]